MLGLWVLARVSNEKRQELVQSLSAFMAEAPIRPSRRFILQDPNDESLVAWLGYWRSRDGLERFLASPTFHAIKGATKALGRLEEIHRLELHSLESPKKEEEGDTT